MTDKSKKKGVTIYLSESYLQQYKEACEEQSRNMASQGELLIKKFILNSKRKGDKS
jgi:hypothetical protein